MSEFIVVGTRKHSHVEFVTICRSEYELACEFAQLRDWGVYDQKPGGGSLNTRPRPKKAAARCAALRVGDSTEYEHSGGGNIYIKKTA